MTFFRRPYLLFCLVITFFFCGYSTVYALSPAEAAKQAAKQSGGKVLKVKEKKGSGYHVKVLMPNGQIRTLKINTKKGDNN